MALLSVRHLTVYRYSQPVGLGEHRMMFRPRESHDLRLLEARLQIAPHPVSLRWLHDVFDNSLAIATIDCPAAELRFDSTVTLEHVETTLPDYTLEDYARTYPFRYADDELPDLARGLVRHYPSDDVDHWTKQFLDPLGRTGTIGLLMHGCRCTCPAPDGWISTRPIASIGNRNLIRVAVAWDPKQVLPLWGTYFGEASSFLGMDVSINVTEGALN